MNEISEQVKELQQPEPIEKIKASSAEIVVHGSKEKPYYEIKYHDLSDGKCHIGYSSYDLDYVFRWLEECFELVEENRVGISEQLNYGGGWITCEDRFPEETGFYMVTKKIKETGERFTGKSCFDVERGWDDPLNFVDIMAWQPLPEPYRP